MFHKINPSSPAGPQIVAELYRVRGVEHIVHTRSQRRASQLGHFDFPGYSGRTMKRAPRAHHTQTSARAARMMDGRLRLHAHRQAL